jgi:hypothetical protein
MKSSILNPEKTLLQTIKDRGIIWALIWLAFLAALTL